MFDNYVGAKTAKSGAWTANLVLAAVILHVFAGAALLIQGWWSIDELERPQMASVSSGTAPPPPPPPPGGSSKKIERKKAKVTKVKEVTQVDERKEKPKVDEDASESPDEGVEGGVEGGVVGGVVGGVIGGVEGGVLGGTLGAEPPPPPPIAEPKIVPQVALEAQRVSGDKDIQPPNDVGIKISRAGKRVTGVVKMCLNGSGNVNSLNMLKKTGYPTYDAKLKSKMRQWKYRPFKVNGKPVPVCASVTFIYIPQ